MSRKQVAKSETIQKNSAMNPYIPASTILPETTLKSILLGIVLAIVLAGSNAYLGLKMGQTISASIPAAVISMSVLRLFRNSNILENNIVQTIASAGEVVAAGVIFTIPALVVMGHWKTFDYWQITMIAIIGGILGVMYSIPLRRALIVESDLKFPEGVAIAEVLKVGDIQQKSGKAGGVGFLISGALGASLLKLSQTGLHIMAETFSAWGKFGSTVFGFSNGLSLSLLGAGYIVGLNVAVNLFIGLAIVWLVGVPLYTTFTSPQDLGLPLTASAEEWAMAVRAAKFRYIGVGTMVTGGLWALVSLIKPIQQAVVSSIEAFRKSRQGIAVAPLRTEHDIPMVMVIAGVLLLAIPLTLIFNNVLSNADLALSTPMYLVTLLFLTLGSLFIGFICASIGGYMAGIVGSSCNPLSGITIGAILIISFSLLVILGAEIKFGIASKETLSLAAVVIMIGAVVAVAASLSCDNLQDLKSGQLVGSTPWRQQLTLIVGVIAGGLVVAPILQLLYEAYGIGGVFPRPGMNPAHSLAAPQATLMASVAQGIFEHTLDWPLVLIGVGLGVGVIIIDRLVLEKIQSPYRLSVLAIALGIYLPIDVTMPIVLGGIISKLAKLAVAKKSESLTTKAKAELESATDRQGLLFSAGMIAGDALLGILLAIPFAAYQSTTILAIVGPGFEQGAAVLGTTVFVGFMMYLYHLSTVQKLGKQA